MNRYIQQCGHSLKHLLKKSNILSSTSLYMYVTFNLGYTTIKNNHAITCPKFIILFSFLKKVHYNKIYSTFSRNKSHCRALQGLTVSEKFLHFLYAQVPNVHRGCLANGGSWNMWVRRTYFNWRKNWTICCWQTSNFR